jgi:hypothetical protein
MCCHKLEQSGLVALETKHIPEGSFFLVFRVLLGEGEEIGMSMMGNKEANWPLQVMCAAMWPL